MREEHGFGRFRVRSPPRFCISSPQKCTEARPTDVRTRPFPRTGGGLSDDPANRSAAFGGRADRFSAGSGPTAGTAPSRKAPNGATPPEAHRATTRCKPGGARLCLSPALCCKRDKQGQLRSVLWVTYCRVYIGSCAGRPFKELGASPPVAGVRDRTFVPFRNGKRCDQHFPRRAWESQRGPLFPSARFRARGPRDGR